MITSINSLISRISLQNRYIQHKTLRSSLHLLNTYIGKDWETHLNFPESGYNRIPIFTCNDYEMLLLCWSHNSKTPIHCHPENGCILKVLSGSLIEDRHLNEDIIVTTPLYPNVCSYIDNSIGLHKIANTSRKSVSLHIYSPPSFKNIIT